MIRKASQADIPKILEIYSAAKHFMRTHGNPSQWNGEYPNEALLSDDIKKGNLYVVTDEENAPYGVFALIYGIDETYEYIEGEWHYDTPYATIHRIASDGTKKGVMKACFDFARESYNHLRVDTHDDNVPMQNAVKKCGFEYTGTIYIADGSPRRAYDWCKE